jgi:hypothetical protein
MTRKLFCLLAIPLLLAVTGCRSPVPANTISIKSPRGDWRIATPKNVNIQGLAASVDTNGVFSLRFDKWTSTNDPEVISKAAAGQAAIAREYFTGISGIAEKLAAGAAKGASPLP